MRSKICKPEGTGLENLLITTRPVALVDQLYTKQWIEFYRHKYRREYSETFARIAKLMEEYNPNAKDMLELACGLGDYSKLFAGYKFNAGQRLRVTATDLSSDSIAWAKKNVNEPEDNLPEFRVLDMSQLNELQRYDIVACLFESWRYHRDHNAARKAMKAVADSLKPRGLFFVDFNYFPPTPPEGSLRSEETVMPDGSEIVQNMHYTTRRDEGSGEEKDYREESMTVTKDGRVATFPIQREPLLRISPQQMQSMIQEAGLHMVRKIDGFRGTPQSTLYVGQKP